MKSFKSHWGISKNWQLLYPVFGMLALGYSCYKLALLFGSDSTIVSVAITALLLFTLLKLTLLLFKFLESRWKVDQKWKVIRIFIVFAITGSLSLVVTRPVFEGIGFVKPNFDLNTWTLIAYYILKFFFILPFYTLLLVFFGWVFREFVFFKNFALKMVSRFGLKKFTKQFESE